MANPEWTDPREWEAKPHIGDQVELITSGVVTRVCGIDESDNTFLDECGGWHSLDDAVPA